MRVLGLYTYPVKGCRALALEEATLGAPGMEGDRRFAFIDGDARALTQRDQPLLATVDPVVDREKLELDFGGLTSLAVAFDEFNESTAVDVWGNRIGARAVQADVASDYFGMRVRLAMLDAASARTFVDSKPLLVTTSAMLAQLGLPGIGMERFRPNMVLEGRGEWRELRGREFILEHVEPCSRCEVTTIDQASGARRGPQPLATLNERFAGNFGVYCRVVRAGTIARGETLRAA